MRILGYYFFKTWVTIGLFFYYKNIRITGIEQVPKNKPILLLSNHQNALIDALLLATKSNRKPWYLARGDIFKNPKFGKLFRFLQMIPIYRIRDGKASLAKNSGIFNECAALLKQKEAILIFPEANHNLKRRVRPLSKGFTRLLFSALEQDKNLDIQLIPVGQNYQKPSKVGDKAALYFGKPIAVQSYLKQSYSEKEFIDTLKQLVFEGMQQQTTHIADETTYDEVLQQVEQTNPDFTYPERVNEVLKTKVFTNKKESAPKILTNVLFRVWNAPFVLLWRTLVKPKVPELEFMDTFRLVFCLLSYPMVYGIIILLSNALGVVKMACLIILIHAIVNLLWVKVVGLHHFPKKDGIHQ